MKACDAAIIELFTASFPDALMPCDLARHRPHKRIIGPLGAETRTSWRCMINSKRYN